ncbi:unnamed protein product [Closterium sp. Yama58-4]|nr:unnamed protein product [Closterium sp. Yama58-4]
MASVTKLTTSVLSSTVLPALPKTCNARAALPAAGFPQGQLRLHHNRLRASFQKSLHLPVSSRSFPCVRAVSVEGETVVEETVETVPESTDAAAEQAPAAAAEEKKEERKARPGATRRRKVTVNVEDLQPGQELTGKVRSVKPYGAFVDIGAFTDGLVHISQLATGFVNKVEDVVTVGQEVTVRVIEASKESGRIALTMRDPEAERVAAEETAAVDAERKASAQQRRQAAGGAEGDAPERKVAGRGRRQQREDQKPTHNYKKGQKVKGVVKNLTSYGCFVELEGKVEGLLHASEIAPGGDMVPVESLVSVGQELEVTIAKVEKNRISLTMKEEVDVTLFNETSPQDEELRALNPFEAAFRRANLVTDAPRRASAAAEAEEEILLLEKKDKSGEEAETVETVAEAVEEADEKAAEAVAAAVEEEAAKEEEKVEEEAAAVPVEAVAAAEPAATEAVAEAAEGVVVADIPAVEEKKEAEAAPAPAPAATPAAGGISAAVVKQLREETGAGMMACKKALADANGDLETAREILRKKGLASADKKASRIASEGLVSSYVHSDRIGVLIEVNCETDFVARGSAFQELVEDLGMQVAACPQVEVVSVEDVPAEQVAKEREVELGKEDLASKPEAVRGKIVDGRMAKRLNELALLEQPYIKNDKVLVKDVVKQAIASLGENIRIRRFVRFNLGEGIEKKSADFAAEVAAASQVQAPAAPAAPAPAAAPAAEAAPEPAADKPKVAVSMAAVKQLRDATGAGMMDCKKALESTGGDVDSARELLRKKGLASADKKASRIAAEGIVGSYIHDGRIGALIEINCETDFVARGEKFRELVDDLAMQVVACPGVQVVSEEDVDPAWLAKEREIEMGKEDLASKPEAVRGKIVDGRLAKRVSELALLEQPFIKNDKVTVKEVVKEVVAALGENIRVRRFERFTLGEGIEKKVSDFAAEVAAAAGQA